MTNLCICKCVCLCDFYLDHIDLSLCFDFIVGFTIKFDINVHKQSTYESTIDIHNLKFIRLFTETVIIRVRFYAWEKFSLPCTWQKRIITLIFINMKYISQFYTLSITPNFVRKPIKNVFKKMMKINKCQNVSSLKPNKRNRLFFLFRFVWIRIIKFYYTKSYFKETIETKT